jgi:MshEN domain
MEDPVHSWPALGALLIRDKLVSKSDLEAVLVRQRISGEQNLSGRRLGELLVERGLIGPTQLARLLAEQYELPFVELDGSDVNLQVAMLLTEELARRLSALPISQFPDGSVLVGVADPTSVHLSDELRRALGAPVRFAVAVPEKIDAAITFVHQRPHAFIERGGRETSSRDAVVMNVGLEDVDTAPASERERTRTSDLERRAQAEWLGALLIRDGLVSDEELESALRRLRAEEY